jgi:hypothetical protein
MIDRQGVRCASLLPSFARKATMDDGKSWPMDREGYLRCLASRIEGYGNEMIEPIKSLVGGRLRGAGRQAVQPAGQDPGCRACISRQPFIGRERGALGVPHLLRSIPKMFGRRDSAKAVPAHEREARRTIVVIWSVMRDRLRAGNGPAKSAARDLDMFPSCT